MKKYVVLLLALWAVFSMSACGSVSFSGNNNSSASTAADSSANEAAESSDSQDVQTAEVTDCDAYMQEFADQCFKLTVFDESGALRNDVDENGNDLGPVDQDWAADYCACFAQTAFQRFGCSTVNADESLGDDEWVAKYTPIQDVCVDAVRGTDAADAAVEGDAAAEGDAAVKSSIYTVD